MLVASVDNKKNPQEQVSKEDGPPAGCELNDSG